MRVAVMQPYFYPYMGYFRLIAAVDLFILFDCVQFPRRGRVHRTEVPDGQGGSRWLTLPLARAARDTRIDALQFAEDAAVEFGARLTAMPWWAGSPQGLRDAVCGPFEDPMDYLERNLQSAARMMGIETGFARSSGFAIPDHIRRGERVRAVAQAAGATQYLNAPGGRALYDPQDFAAAGLTLEFLAPYDGPRFHMLHALATEPAAELAADAANWKREPA